MIRNREAIILAGGFGTRLSHVVSDVPKPMALVCSRPFLRFVLDQLDANGFNRVVIADGYKRECIEKYFGDSYRGLQLIYSPETEPLLTGGAVKKALNFCTSDWVYVFNGDTYLDVSFDAFEAVRASAGDEVQAILACKMMYNFDRYGTLSLECSRITSFNEKQPCKEGLINAGVYLLRRDCLCGMPEVFSLENDYFERVVESGNLYAAPCGGTFIDIGIPEDYSRAQDLLLPLVKQWKLAMFDRDGTLNVDTGHLYEPDKLELINEGVELLRQYSADPEYKVVVVTNQAGIAKGLYTVEDMRKLHIALDSVLEEKGCRIDAYYFCPHHPDFTGPCDCRKPAPGMILKALFDFDAIPEKCVLYGDKLTDMDAAKAVGVRGVLVDSR